MTIVHLAPKSKNAKTGPIPVSTTDSTTCPDACPLKGNGCYAELSHLGMFWRKVNNGLAGTAWDQFTRQINALPNGQLWRHNQAGDLPGTGDAIDAKALGELVKANAGKRGFTYTHKPLTPRNAKAIKSANAKGFTINLSGNNLAHADTLADSSVGPVVVVLPSNVQGNVKDIRTPKGRRVVVCPATYRDDTTCATCGLCAVLERQVIVGFPAHGVSARTKVDHIAKGL